jgi:acyl-CoA reductase-like NAD-dependent aldehyde dehydrogenase
MSWRTIIVPQHVYDEIMRRAKAKNIPAWKVIAELLNLAPPAPSTALGPASDLDQIKLRLAELERQLAELKRTLSSGEISNAGPMLGPHAREVQSVDPQLPDFVKSNPWLHVIAQRQ